MTCSSKAVVLLLLLIIQNLCGGQRQIPTRDEGTTKPKGKVGKNGDGGGLKLTPLIKAGKVRQAREGAKVILGDISSYSGFLTVNALHCNSNLFFWFFPAINDTKTAPVILWHGGGPGTSALVGLFTEHGPFYVPTSQSNSLKFRNTTLTQTHSVLYIDSPVGSGFSYTEDDSCYCESADETAKDIYDALLQFFTIFPEFRQNDFFVNSGSYGGKFVPAVGFKIHLENQLLSASKQSLKINLKGLMIASGFTDPINQIDYGDFYYSLGLISEDDLEHFKIEENRTKIFIKTQQWEDAFNTCEPLVIGCCYPNPKKSFFENATGFTNSLNLLYANRVPGLDYHIKILQSKVIRESLHVGNLTFDNTNSLVYEKLKKDIYQSLKSIVEELLNAGYNFLIYSGQLDLIVPHTTVRNYIEHLNWKNAEKFHKSKRKTWKSGNGDIAGYVNSVGGLTYVFVRNAGHKPYHDQPQLMFEMITNFTRNSFFANGKE